MSGTPIRLTGAHLLLRDLEEADVGERYVKWMNDPLVTAYLESRFSTHSRDTLLDYLRAVRATPETLFLAIVLRTDGRHIGNIKLGPVHPHHRSAELGLMIGERDAWGKGYGTEAIRLVAAHAFGAMGVHRIGAGCYASNPGSVQAFLRAGFRVEGTLPAQFRLDSGYVDGVRLGLVSARR